MTKMQKIILGSEKMKASSPLFSFVIISYYNYQYIFEALDSLFAQTYPNIELLVSNDGSSDFNEKELTDYIQAHKRENITRVLVRNLDKNVGTVRNLEQIRPEVHGEYIMYMAADDALYDENVLTRYAEKFEELGPQADVVTSLTAMCSHTLDEIVEYIPKEDEIKIIKEDTPLQLFSYLTHTLIIPTTSTCYRRSLYKKINPYDNAYHIIEDAPFFLKLAREGIKIHFIDNMIGARHRAGGISHGNTLNLSEGQRWYHKDEVVLFEKDILPYKKDLLPSDRKKTLEKWKYIERMYKQLLVEDLTPKELLKRRLRHLPFIFLHMLYRFVSKLWQLLNSKEVSNIVGFTALSMGALCLLSHIGVGFGASSMWDAISAAAFGTLLFLQAVRLLGLLYRTLLFVILGRETLKKPEDEA